MKALNKFLWMCFTCVVNVFYNPNNALGGVVMSIVSSFMMSSDKTGCGNMPTDELSCYDNATDAKNFASALGLKEPDICKGEDKYVVSCKTMDGSTQNANSCLSSEVGSILELKCETCPEESIVGPNTNVFKVSTVEFWLCDEDEQLSLSSGVFNTASSGGVRKCIRYKINEATWQNKKLEKDCYRTAKPKDKDGYEDEKGTFTYTENCYIDTE